MSGTRTDAPGTGVPAAGDRSAPPVRRRFVARPGRRAVLVLLVAVTVLAGGGTWTVYGSPWLRAEHVTVRGAHALTARQIEHAAGVPLGGALASVDAGAVRGRLLAALPRVAAVEVRRSWPHTVVLDVTERVAAAVVAKGARFTEVDADGVDFATVDRRPAGVPLVRLTPDATPAATAAATVFGPQRLLRAAVEVAAELPAAVRGHATAIRVRSYDGITVELSGGREVMWGSAERGTVKATVLSALIKAEPHATRYDVSAPTAPAASGS